MTADHKKLVAEVREKFDRRINDVLDEIDTVNKKMGVMKDDIVDNAKRTQNVDENQKMCLRALTNWTDLPII